MIGLISYEGLSFFSADDVLRLHLIICCGILRVSNPIRHQNRVVQFAVKSAGDEPEMLDWSELTGINQKPRGSLVWDTLTLDFLLRPAHAEADNEGTVRGDGKGACGSS
jgi:hypothetical protein